MSLFIVFPVSLPPKLPSAKLDTRATTWDKIVGTPWHSRAGDKLGPYEIIALIGKGGMGEVYRARDTRLGRDVAIKISQEQFNERFEREARAVASLNHPNICSLYDVGPNYLVMEYVEGESPGRPDAHR